MYRTVRSISNGTGNVIGKKYALIIAGNKSDLRDDEETVDRLRSLGAAPVRAVDAAGAALAVGARHYVECSAKTGSNVAEVFERAAAIGLNHKRNEERGGCGWVRKIRRKLM